MPTTLTGLLLFVILLLPGFAYLVGKERHGTERHTSPFRETVAIVAASITSELAVLGLFAAVRTAVPSWTPDVGALIRHGGGTYVTSHYRSLATLGLILLGASTGLAYLVTVPRVRRVFARVPVIGAYPHDSTVSGWWVLFEKWRVTRKTVPGRKEGKTRKVKVTRAVNVGCVLDDGSYVSGWLGSFNNSADDSPNRDLVLKAPIKYRPPSAAEPIQYPSASAAGIPASRIVTLFVGYVDRAEQSPVAAASEPVPLRLAGLQAEQATLEPTAAAPSENRTVP
jgi:Family of unknown function (DUF6338)